ncbi:hypothetical protein TUMSATVNIG1_16480 [Vibrio nigripulchritudo]|uniref:hypothetical protein n=1 Tax=Vibrio TaxID=662 RepID=UPI00190D5DC0|nr:MULTISPECIES: hypothetical protein [Vibrio]UAB72158.1 hypothetical protein INR79_09675 [Vibrio sp. SCSIO 43132]UAB74122.1 hypothetical protein INR79_24320 [Vibrio sp. SCSIO 43132]BCL69692.1 hypothetical protein VNTUMSATTG_16290 [Vibrio nigripulchritudo]BDU31039.1 hypothetical protein TUMSATVNIG1_16480 [Vibrio nigripulchritudo]
MKPPYFWAVFYFTNQDIIFMKVTPKNIAIVGVVALVVSVGVVWASNNVDAVEDTIG